MTPDQAIARIAELLNNLDHNTAALPTYASIHRSNTLDHIRRVIKLVPESHYKYPRGDRG